jgi:hypothetical protein
MKKDISENVLRLVTEAIILAKNRQVLKVGKLRLLLEQSNPGQSKDIEEALAYWAHRERQLAVS